LKAEVRLYDYLFSVPNPAEVKEKDFKELLNFDSLKVIKEARVESILKDAQPLDHFQFQRIGYFNLDPDSTSNHLVFNRTVSLKDTWGKISGKLNN
jgi:glutaminyl-tRNA synthetase